MNKKKEMIAMLLAGGQGSRLDVLTKDVAKPAVPFGGKYRIIDFTLSNCVNSGVTNVGVLTQYKPLELNTYVGNGQPWDLDRMDGGLSILPPYTGGKTGEWYKGTANAIYQNFNYIEQYNPEYVLILSADHIYKMNYSIMLEFHKMKEADLTIAVLDVPFEEASRFGIMNTNEDLSVYEFEEKPECPKSNKASMGIYIFTWKKLKEYLEKEELSENTNHDFGKDVIPLMIEAGEKVFAYPYQGYWKDVGTIESLWEANMDLVRDTQIFNIHDPLWRIYYRHFQFMPQYAGERAKISKSLVCEGSDIRGSVHHSVISPGVFIEEGAEVHESVIMAGAVIRSNAKVYRSIIAVGAQISQGATVGEKDSSSVCVIGKNVTISEHTNVEAGLLISESI